MKKTEKMSIVSRAYGSLDEKDQKILDILRTDADYTVRQISKATMIPATTVHSRILSLKKEGIIRNYTVNLDHKKIGNKFTAIIFLSVDYEELRSINKDQHQLARELKSLPEVEWVDIVTGEIDMIAKVRVPDVDAFDEFLFHKLQKMKGIGKTQSAIVINET